MKLSVVIPAYNCAALVGATLDSLCAQRFTDFEVLIINDGSTDDTLAVLNDYAAKDARIRVITVENGGPARARNIGIEKAQGEYLSFLDSDDFIEPEMYAQMMALAEAHDLDEVVCGYRMVSEDGAESKEFRFAPFVAETPGEFREKVTALNQEHLMFVVWNKLFRTSMIQDAAIRFPEAYLSSEDRLFNALTLPRIRRFGFVDETFYHYYLRGQSSLNRRYVANRFEAACACHETLLASYEEMGILSEENRAALDFMFVKGVLSCFTQLCARGCPLTYKEKKAYIGEVLTHELVKSAIAHDDASFGYSKIVCGVLRTGNKGLIYAMSKGIFFLQFRANALYLKLKHRRKGE